MNSVSAFFLAFSLTCAAGLRAQDIPVRTQEPGLQQQDITESEKAAIEAKKESAVESGPDVTYADVLEHPDDVELNYRFALKQIHKGNLRNAMATLERILMVQPNLPKVRLVYAIVLFRLDDLDDAERELTGLKSQPMPPTLRAEFDDYLRQIRLRRRTTHLDLFLGAGMDYDDNRNASPASGRRLFFDTPVTLTSESRRKGDVAKTMMANVSVQHDLGYQAGHLVFADYGYYRAEQTNQRILNLQNHSADAGLVYKTFWADFTPTFEFNHLLLTQTTYLRSLGGRFRMDGKVSPRLSPFLEGAGSRQEYNRTLIVVDGDGRTGDHWEGTGGLSFVLTPTMKIVPQYTHIEQGALAKYYAYRRESYQLGHTWLLGKGQFLYSSGIIDVDRYKAPQASVSSLTRKDKTYRARVTYGFPLGLIAKPLENFVWLFTYDYYQAISNIIDYSYTNNKYSTLMTYKWGI